jgi:hypothetical protein
MSSPESGSGTHGDPSWDILETAAQAIHPKAPPDCTDTFATWNEVIGNTRPKRALGAFASQPHRPHHHIFLYGANRSGKTGLVHLGLQAKFCRNRGDSLNPCQQCDSCRRWLSGARFRNGQYFNGKETFEYVGVDGTDTATFDEDRILGARDWPRPLILFLDEVASPAFAAVVPKLLKPMMESPITVIACAVRAKGVRNRNTGRIKPGVPPDFRFRFNIIEKTTTASEADFLMWLEHQCQRRAIKVDDKSTLGLIWQKALGVPGQALRLLHKAEFLQLPLTRSFLDQFRWDAE